MIYCVKSTREVNEDTSAEIFVVPVSIQLFEDIKDGRTSAGAFSKAILALFELFCLVLGIGVILLNAHVSGKIGG